MSSAEGGVLIRIIGEEHSFLPWPYFRQALLWGMGSRNGCIFLQLTVPKRSFERRIDGITGSCFSQRDRVAWSRWRGAEPRSSMLKGIKARAHMLAALPRAFARPVLWGQVERKSLGRVDFPCPLLSVCHKWLTKQWGNCDGDRSLVSGCYHSHASDLSDG